MATLISCKSSKTSQNVKIETKVSSSISLKNFLLFSYLNKLFWANKSSEISV